MLDFFSRLFDTTGFVPRSECGDWTPGLVALHNLSDAVIWLAYLAIPVFLLLFIRRRRDMPFPKVFWMFGGFIVLCGFTHLLDIVMFHAPMYRLSGVVKLATAGVSLGTAVALVPLIPVALALRSPRELDLVNRRLESEVAERRKAEAELARRNEELRAKEDFARALTATASDAIVSADATGTIVSWNRGAEATFGWRADEAIGKPLTLLIPERHRAAHREGLARVAAGGEPRVLGRPLELTGLRKGGGEFELELRIDAWSSGGATFFTGIVRDVTERRRRTDQIERLNRELEAFSWSVSHDLRAPLRAIDGFVKILEQDHAARLDDEGRRALQVVGDGARRMGQLIDDLLELSRTGRAALQRSEVDMRELAASVVEEAVAAAAPRRIGVFVRDLPRANGDRRLLRQLFANLVDNAIKYTRDRDPARIVIGSEAGPDGPIWFVRDDGVGFDMARAQKLFGVFQRLHSDAEFPGTGVGLALVRRIVTLHGGRVWAEATVGGGATLRFTLGLPGSDPVSAA